MFFSAEINGAMFGFGVMCYSNSIRKMRMMRRKPQHALCDGTIVG